MQIADLRSLRGIVVLLWLVSISFTLCTEYATWMGFDERQEMGELDKVRVDSPQLITLDLEGFDQILILFCK